MPTYEYECIECSHRFEAFQKITEKPLNDCPECAGRVRRLISSGCGLIFKGSGFYITDYKKSSSSGKPGPDKPKEEQKPAACAQTCPMSRQCSGK